MKDYQLQHLCGFTFVLFLRGISFLDLTFRCHEDAGIPETVRERLWNSGYTSGHYQKTMPLGIDVSRSELVYRQKDFCQFTHSQKQYGSLELREERDVQTFGHAR